jgi:HD-like signal output (HDOD) protein
MSKTLLFVDRDSEVLRALRRLFFHTAYETHYTTDTAEALELLDEHRVDLLITDLHMPDVAGGTFIDVVKERFPLTLRVALTGYREEKASRAGLDDNLVKFHLFKPWDKEELLAMVDRLFELEDTLSDRKLLNIINNLEKLPTVPDLYERLNHMIEEEASINEITRMLEEDQSISSRILRVANSAFYSAKTGSINQAILYIGLLNVKNIVLSNSVFSTLVDERAKGERLWEHASLSNKLFHLFYNEILGKRVPDEYASAGLLHDVGRVVIINNYPDAYFDLVSRAREVEDVEYMGVEKSLIGANHAKIGGYLLNWWGIPLPIVEAALYHHDPLNPAVINKEMVAMVHLANYYSWRLLHEGTEVIIAFEEAVFDRIDKKEQAFERLIARQRDTLMAPFEDKE